MLQEGQGRQGFQLLIICVVNVSISILIMRIFTLVDPPPIALSRKHHLFDSGVDGLDHKNRHTLASVDRYKTVKRPPRYSGSNWLV